ncbi:S1C family serine protease [Streptomyces sp. NPDC058274]|uniref:S1C family serine protease n=1 Tax=Streptomyces sp. NPDC058274 TaxID=3346416 RepID=UPI0036EB0ABD
MTESFRRSGEYEHHEQGDQSGYVQGSDQRPAYPEQQQHASSPVDPQWPAPPAYQPVQPVAVEPGTTVWPGSGQGAGGGGHDGHGGAPAGAYGAEPPAGSTAVLTAEPLPGGPAHAPKKRAKGPLALLAAVAIAAAAVGGGTAYAFQELTGTDNASSSTSTTVVPAAQKGTVAGVAAAVSPSIVEITATLSNGTSTGSGVILTTGGEILTNNHVISGASSIKVTTSNGKSYTAKTVGTDSKKDLALVKLENAPSGLKTATLGNSDAVKVGDSVVAIGSPEGLTGTVTSGIVSALDRDVTVSTDEGGQQGQGQQGGGSGQWPFEFGGRQFNGDTGSSTTTYKALQTDASLNPGNSGGALIDMNGNIIGINSAMYSAADATSSSSAGSVGLGFAIPINTVKSDLATLRAGGSD